jgi:outer membrane biosynthesis protein TonB
MRHAYEFHPVKQGQTSPALYALQSFRIQPLGAKPRMEVLSTTTDTPRTTAPRTHRPWISSRRWVSHIAAAAVAIVLFFALSTPVENTYVDNGNYASLGTNGLFDAIRSESLLANVVNPIFDQSDKKTNNSKSTAKTEKKAEKKAEKETKKAEKQETKKDNADKKNSDKKDDKKVSDNKDNKSDKKDNKSDKKDNGQQQPVKVGEEKVPANQQQPANQQPANQQPTNAVTSTVSNIYHLIVSSLTTLADAQKELNNYIQKGYTNATIVEGNGRYRISLGDYTDMGTANNKLNELKKKDDSFKGAWLLRN